MVENIKGKKKKFNWKENLSRKDRKEEKMWIKENYRKRWWQQESEQQKL